jgi:pseudouridine synthase
MSEPIRRKRPNVASDHPRRRAERTIDRVKRRRARMLKAGEVPTTHEGHVPEELRDSARGVRLQKALAGLGIASRRHCETLIAEGHVQVNGQLVTGLPAWVDPASDVIALDGVELNPGARRGHATEVGVVVVALHKPRHVLCTTADPAGRKQVADLVQLPPGFAQRLFPVGRLDAESTGLVLLTNDGELGNRLTHPRYRVPKQYRVMVKGAVSPEQFELLRNGVYVPTGDDGEGPARKMKAHSLTMGPLQKDRLRGDRTTLALTLTEGRNLDLFRFFARVGLRVRRLQRVAIGPVTLKGLAIGKWRLLEPREVNELRAAIGLEKARRKRKAAGGQRKPGARRGNPAPGPAPEPNQ